MLRTHDNDAKIKNEDSTATLRQASLKRLSSDKAQLGGGADLSLFATVFADHIQQ